MDRHHPWNDGLARDLNRQFGDAPAARIVEAVIEGEFSGRIALVSSFGAESAVLLHLAAAVDPAVPVIFLETGKLFPETLEYRDRLIDRLGLADVRSLRPAAADLADHDPNGRLWAADPDRCCFLRKVLPLHQALQGFDAWFTGRKRHHGGDRADLPVFEAEDGRIKVNPLAHWSHERVQAYLDKHGLPRHPLENEFPSIGCVPCTAPAGAEEGVRAGRWRGLEKTECGIHGPARSHAPSPAAGNVFAVEHPVAEPERADVNGHRGGVMWMTGLSGSGKTTLVMALERHLFDLGWQVFALDGDNLRHGLSGGLGFSPGDRTENIRRAAEAAKLLAEAGSLVIAGFISPLRVDRRMARNIIGEDFHEVFVDADLATCESRDPKGLYARARAGEIKEFTGISAPYEPPEEPALRLDTVAQSVDGCLMRLTDYVSDIFLHDSARLRGAS